MRNPACRPLNSSISVAEILLIVQLARFCEEVNCRMACDLHILVHYHALVTYRLVKNGRADYSAGNDIALICTKQQENVHMNHLSV